MTILPRRRSSSTANAGRASRTRVTFATTPGVRMFWARQLRVGPISAGSRRRKSVCLGSALEATMRASISSPFARATPSTEPRLVRMAETSTPHRTVAPLVRAAARSASVRLSGPPRAKTVRPAAPPPGRVPQEVERRPGRSRAHGGVANAPRPEHATQRFVVDRLAHEIRDGHGRTLSVSWTCRLPRCRSAFASVRPLKPSASDGAARSGGSVAWTRVRNRTRERTLRSNARNPSASLGRPVRSSVAVRAGSRHNVMGGPADGAKATTSGSTARSPYAPS